MTNRPAIQRVDRTSDWAQQCIESEERLFRHYGVSLTEHTIRLQDPALRIRALETGTGPPLILVPGGSGEAIMFAPLMNQFRDRRIITFDRPGGGLSDAINHLEVDLRDLAVHTLEAIFDHFNLDSAPIFANSMGGLWTFWFALDRPDRVSRIIQAGCPALLLETSAPLFQRLLSVPGINRLLLSLTLPDTPEDARKGLEMMGSSGSTVRDIPAILAEMVCLEFNRPTYPLAWLSLMRAALRLWGANKRYQFDSDSLSHITQPTLFLWGNNDPFGGVETGQRATEILSDAELVTLEAGHLPFIDAPEFCARRIQEFLPG